MKHRRPKYPPMQPGEIRLCHLPRGADTFMRVCYAVFKGHPYVGLRLWRFSSRQWLWLPSPKVGCTVRVSELDGVIDALVAVRDAVAREHKPKQQRIAAASKAGPGDEAGGAA